MGLKLLVSVVGGREPGFHSPRACSLVVGTGIKIISVPVSGFGLSCRAGFRFFPVLSRFFFSFIQFFQVRTLGTEHGKHP